jgi:hypothetical protein
MVLAWPHQAYSVNMQRSEIAKKAAAARWANG